MKSSIHAIEQCIIEDLSERYGIEKASANRMLKKRKRSKRSYQQYINQEDKAYQLYKRYLS